MDAVQVRRAEQQYCPRSTVQCYVQQALQNLYLATNDADDQTAIAVLEAAFRRPLTRVLTRELQAIKRTELDGMALLQELKQLYIRYGLDQSTPERRQEDNVDKPQLVCSDVLV